MCIVTDDNALADLLVQRTVPSRDCFLIVFFIDRKRGGNIFCRSLPLRQDPLEDPLEDSLEDPLEDPPGDPPGGFLGLLKVPGDS